MGDADDLKDVYTEEKGRGKKQRVDTSARRQRSELLKDLRLLLESGDERKFLEAIRALGLKDGSPEFERVWRVWREYRRGY